MLAPGRGLRRAPAADIAGRMGAGEFAVAAEISGALGEARLGTGVEPRAGTAELERRFRVDGETEGSSAAFGEHLRILWLTPDQDGLFRGPAGDRRRFLDRLVLAIDPGHAARASQFERALKERNRLLEDDRPDAAWLTALEREASGLAVAIAAARTETVSRLRQLIDRLPDGVFPKAAITLDGELEARIGSAPASEIEHWYQAALREGRMRDKAAGRTLVGPQASDLAVLHAGKAMPAGLSSTGEQKALLTGLILAQAELVADMTGIAPILLLDEASAHLDPRRRRALFERLTALPGQVWMTGTEAGLFEGCPPATLRFMIENAGARAG